MKFDCIAQVEPNVSSRSCGGWLAYSTDESPLKIGVTASDRDSALKAYSDALAQWKRNLDRG